MVNCILIFYHSWAILMFSFSPNNAAFLLCLSAPSSPPLATHLHLTSWRQAKLHAGPPHGSLHDVGLRHWWPQRFADVRDANILPLIHYHFELKHGYNIASSFSIRFSLNWHHHHFPFSGSPTVRTANAGILQSKHNSTLNLQYTWNISSSLLNHRAARNCCSNILHLSCASLTLYKVLCTVTMQEL